MISANPGEWPDPPGPATPNVGPRQGEPMETSTTIAPATRQTCVLTRLTARLAACLGLVALAACSAPRTRTAPSPTASTPAPAPAPTPHKNAVRSDFNGDGVSDLVLTDPSASYDGKYAVGYAAVIHGSADGLDLPSHQVITQNDLGLGKAGARRILRLTCPLRRSRRRPSLRFHHPGRPQNRLPRLGRPGQTLRSCQAGRQRPARGRLQRRQLPGPRHH